MSITDSEPITTLSLTKIIVKFDDEQNPRSHHLGFVDTPKKIGQAQEQIGKVHSELQVSHSPVRRSSSSESTAGKLLCLFLWK